MPPRPGSGDGSSPAAVMARIYDVWLGGTTNYEEDRQEADAIEQLYAGTKLMVRRGRLWLSRLVTYAARHGITQYLDLGCGLPIMERRDVGGFRIEGVHAIAHAVNPGAKVVYVDNEPEVRRHFDAVLAGADPTIAFIPADLTDSRGVLAAAADQSLIDLDQPVCVILAMVLHFFPPAQAKTVAAGYIDRIPPGSLVGISVGHNSNPCLFSDVRSELSAAPLHNHSKNTISTFFTGLELEPPGLVQARSWIGGMEGPKLPTSTAYVLAGAGWKR